MYCMKDEVCNSILKVEKLEEVDEWVVPMLEIPDMGHVLRLCSEDELREILQDTAMKTDMWAVGEDPDNIDIVVEEPQPGLAPTEEALEALKRSEELELQASKLEEKAASLWAKAGEFSGKAIQLLQGLAAATKPKAAAEPSPTAGTFTASAPVPGIKVEPVEQCNMQEPAAKKCKAAAPHCLQQGDLQKIFLTMYKTSDYFEPMEAFPMVWLKDLAPKYISRKGQARIHACTYPGCSVQKPRDHQIWSHVAVEHMKTKTMCPFCTAEIGVQGMHLHCGFTSLTSMKEHVRKKHM